SGYRGLDRGGDHPGCHWRALLQRAGAGGVWRPHRAQGRRGSRSAHLCNGWLMGKTGLRFRALMILAAGAIGAGTVGPPPAHAGARPAEAAQPDPALRTLDDCIQRLDPVQDVGYSRIAERCPELAPALAASAWAAWLPHDWDRPGNELSAGGLTEL